MDARQSAFQKILQQLIGFSKACIIGNPHRADIDRQLAPATGQEITTDDGVNSMRFEKTANQVRLGHVPGMVYAFHSVRTVSHAHSVSKVRRGGVGAAE